MSFRSSLSFFCNAHCSLTVETPLILYWSRPAISCMPSFLWVCLFDHFLCIILCYSTFLSNFLRMTRCFLNLPESFRLWAFVFQQQVFLEASMICIILDVLKFYSDVSRYKSFSPIHCSGHLVCPFNIKICVLPLSLRNSLLLPFNNFLFSI